MESSWIYRTTRPSFRLPREDPGFLDEQLDDDVIEVPPFLCVEILSSDDSASRTMERLEDYLAFGVANVWLIDPRSERSYFATPTGLMEAHDNVLSTANPAILLPAGELFESLR